MLSPILLVLSGYAVIVGAILIDDARDRRKRTRRPNRAALRAAQQVLR